MDAGDFDRDRFKREQRESWDAAAPGWEKWWPLFDAGARAVSERLVALARVAPGHRVLDIATGTGEPAITAARKVGPAGRVLGIDQSAGMLEVARRRAAALGLGNVEYRHGDGESLALPAHSFDAVLCRWGLMFMPDLDAAVRGVRDALVEDGWFATAVWASPDKVPMIGIAAETVRKMAGLPAPAGQTFDPTRLADTKILEGALVRNGFREITLERLMVPFDFDSPEAFLESRRDLSAPFRAMLASKPADVQHQILDAVVDAARQYADAQGRVRTSNESILFVARA
jgi:ubiquinone/menaquinone biosynthesis C-methylase UbiE